MPDYRVAGSGTYVRKADGQLVFLGAGAPLPGYVSGAQLTELLENGRVVDAPVATPADGDAGSLTEAEGNATYAPLAENVNTVAASGTAQTLPDATTATMHMVTLTGNCTITLPSPAAGISFAVALKQDGTGSRTVTWSGTIVWDGGSAPTVGSAANAVTEVIFRSYTGTNWRGSLGGSFAS